MSTPCMLFGLPVKESVPLLIKYADGRCRRVTMNRTQAMLLTLISSLELRQIGTAETTREVTLCQASLYVL